MGKRRPRGCRSIIVDNYSNVRMSALQRGCGGMRKVGPSAQQQQQLPPAPPPYTEQPTAPMQQQPNMGQPEQGFAPGYAYPQQPQQQQARIEIFVKVKQYFIEHLYASYRDTTLTHNKGTHSSLTQGILSNNRDTDTQVSNNNNNLHMVHSNNNQGRN